MGNESENKTEKQSVFARKNLNMTEGSIARLLISFSIPLLLGNIFQQMYNMVDAWVVGNFVGNEAFSAVGTVGPIINTLISIYLGISNGAGVVIAQNFGAKHEEAASKAIHTAVTMTVIIAVVMSTIGIAFRDVFLRLMNTPPEVFPEARQYLFIFFCGIGGMMIYNIGAAALQAIGDSVKPFYFLALTTILNIAGDLFFVIKLGMGVKGVALATVLAMAVSATLVMITLFRTKTCIKLSFKKMRIHKQSLGQIVRIGLPAAIQMGIIAFSNIIVQRYINSFGSTVMSGWTAYNKIDGLMALPMQSLSLAASTFVGQNIGFGKVDRAKKGIRTAVLICLTITVTAAIPLMVFAPQLIAFFNPDANVVITGTQILRWMSPFYIFICSANIQNAGLRGAGDSKTPMLMTIFSYVVARQVYLFVMSNYISNTMIPICLGYPFGWIICTILVTSYYNKADLSKKAVVIAN